MPATEPAKRPPRRRFVRPEKPPGCGLRPGQPVWAGGLDWSWAFVIFKQPPGYPNYLIGTDGSLWSRQRRGKTKAVPDWTQVFPAPLAGYGHLTFPFRHEKRFHRLLMHRMVLTTFLGPCPPGKECCHNDGNSANNRVGNLRWDTSKSNAADRRKHGRQPHGERHYRAKLTWEDVAAIRRLIRLGVYHKEIAPIFNVAVSLVGQIGRNERWRE